MQRRKRKTSSKKSSKTSRPGSSSTSRKTIKFVVVRWQDTGVDGPSPCKACGFDNEAIRKPVYVVYDDERYADGTARTWNGLVIRIEGKNVRVLDYKYQDQDGKPMEGEDRGSMMLNSSRHREAL